MANPFPFVAGNVLTAAELNGIGETTTFTPSWNNVTVGNGTLNYATITRVNSFVYVQVMFTLGSTSSVTGNISINNPVTPATVGQNAVGVGLFADANTSVLYPTTISMAAGLMQNFPSNSAGTYTVVNQASATVPFTWTTGDVITFSAGYRVA